MGLVYRPITNRRQQSAFKTDIPEKQTVVCHHNIASLSLLTSAVNKAASPKEGTLMTQAFVAFGSNAPTWNGTVVDFQSIHIVVVALFHERKQPRQSGSLVDLLFTIVNHRRPLVYQTVHLAKARIVAEPFQGSVCDTKSLREKRKLLVNQLIQQCVGLCGNTYCDAVFLCRQGKGNQVSHRLANTSAGLHGEIARRC